MPDPTLPGPDGAIVEVTAAAICGSDLHFYEGDYPLPEPVARGHEAVGTVVETGPDVLTVKVGDSVLVSSVAGCGTCAGCATRYLIMRLSGTPIFGSGALGGAQSELLAVPAADFQLLTIPDGTRHRRSAALDRQPGDRLGGRAMVSTSRLGCTVVCHRAWRRGPVCGLAARSALERARCSRVDPVVGGVGSGP